MTGEGVGLAFVGAQVLVDCVAAGRVDDYDRQWRRVTRRYRLLTVALLRASSYRPVRSCVVPAATALPGVFTHVIGLIGE